MAPVSHVDRKLFTVETLKLEKQAWAQSGPPSRHNLVGTVALLSKEKFPFVVTHPRHEYDGPES